MNAPALRRAFPMLLIAAGLAVPLGAQERSLQAATVWLEQARALFASGSLAEADQFASGALEFLPDWSDALYLRARIALASRDTTRQGIALLSAALKAGTWTTADPDEAAATLGEALVRTRQYGEAIPVLEGVVGRRPQLRAARLDLARAYALSGKAGQALTAATLGWRLFPSETGFAVLASMLLDKAGKRADASKLASEALELRPSDPAVLLRAAELESDPARMTAALDRYAAAGGRDPLAAVLGLEAAGRSGAVADLNAKYLDRFIADGGLGREDLVERASLAVKSDQNATGRLRDALASYSGERTLDADGDGWWEQRWRYSAGVLTDWTLDENQDGMSQLVETFTSGAPASLAFRPAANVLYTAFYDGSYPFVDRVEEQGLEGSRTWYLTPATISIPVAKGRAQTPNQAQVVRAARWVEERKAAGVVSRTVWMEAGVTTSIEEDTTGDGHVDHKLWYVDGQPVRGLRDLTGDGTFPVRETWQGGRLASEIVDTNGDGAPDYEEIYIPSPMKLWDYDEDEFWDSREYPGAGGTVIRDISTKLDGRFDVRIVFKDGRIAEIIRSGNSLPATADPARGVTWIGAVPRGAIPNPSGPEGPRFIGGKGYLLFRFQGTTYLEELQ